MKRLRRLVLLIFLVAVIGVAGFIFITRVDLPFNLGNRNTLPTHTPAPAIENTGTPIPEITSSDGCSAIVEASGIVINPDEAREEFVEEELNTIEAQLPDANPETVDVSQTVPDQVLIEFTQDSSPRDRLRYIRDIDGRARRKIHLLGLYTVVFPNGMPADFPPSPIVVRIENDYVAGATQDPVPPNDPRYSEQWAFLVMGVPDTWAQLPLDAENVTIAVIDSGICLNHPDLQGRVVDGFDFVDNDKIPEDNFGHGCGVAGVIAANTNNAVGIAGVAPNAQIMPLRVLDERGLGTYSNIAAAIIHAVDNEADIINLSLAGPSYSDVMAEAVAYAVENGVTVIGAVGNQGLDTVWYPAAFPSVIAVGSIDPDLERSSFSNFGERVNIYAPGRDIVTTSIDNGYHVTSGTSFAAPQVSGIAAMAQVLGIPLNTEDGIIFVIPPESEINCTG